MLSRRWGLRCSAVLGLSKKHLTASSTMIEMIPPFNLENSKVRSPGFSSTLIGHDSPVHIEQGRLLVVLQQKLGHSRRDGASLRSRRSPTPIRTLTPSHAPNSHAKSYINTTSPPNYHHLHSRSSVSHHFVFPLSHNIRDNAITLVWIRHLNTFIILPIASSE